MAAGQQQVGDGGAQAAEQIEAEETERADAVVERDQDDALACEMFAVVDGRGGRAEGEAAAVDPDEYGQAIRGGLSVSELRLLKRCPLARC